MKMLQNQSGVIVKQQLHMEPLPHVCANKADKFPLGARVGWWINGACELWVTG